MPQEHFCPGWHVFDAAALEEDSDGLPSSDDGVMGLPSDDFLTQLPDNADLCNNTARWLRSHRPHDVLCAAVREMEN